jgi:hypothetical protein
MEVVQPVLDTAVTTWPSLVKHVFDSVWATIGVTLGSFLAGWLLVNKPKFMQRQKD